MKVSELIVLCVFLAVVICSYIGFEERRHERLERIAMRFCDLVEQGKITDEDAQKLRESLK